MSIFQQMAIATGNKFTQKLLQKNVEFCQSLMGIGTGSEVTSSGERSILQLLNRHSNPPYCIFDVGANRGQFLALILEQIHDRDFQVHCFEPGTETFKMLTESVSGDRRVKLNQIGIGPEKGQAILHFDRVGSGLASLTKRKLDHFQIDFSQTESIEIETIDTYCANHQIERINLLKLDIEGHELDALSGATQMFDRRAIDIVAFEFGGCNIDTRTFFQDFWYFFSNINFSIFRVTPSGYLYPISAYSEMWEQMRTTNFVAVANHPRG
jgi:FkbM family methyltransferase